MRSVHFFLGPLRENEVQRLKDGGSEAALRKREVGLALMEVLIVLAILAVLLGLIYPILASRKIGDRRSAEQVAVRNIVAALKSYHSDYGHFPEIVKPLPNGKRVICVGDPACKISDGANSLLFDVLRDIPRGANANHALNPHRQIYFEMGKAKDPKNPRNGFADGPEFPAALQGSLFDPWGRQYCIVFTMDDSGTIDLSAVYSDLAGPEHLIRQPVVAFSLGKDGKPGGNGYEGKLLKPKANEPPDDIVSWQ